MNGRSYKPGRRDSSRTQWLIGLIFACVAMSVAIIGWLYWAPMYVQFKPMALPISVLLLSAVAGLGLVWRQQRMRFFRTEREAEENRARLATIVEASEDAIIGKGLDGTVTSWNASAERLFGYSASEMIGQSITRIVPPNERYKEADTLQRVSRGERVKHSESVLLAKDGRLIAVSMTVSPILNEGGTIIGAARIVRDITERRQKDEKILLLNTELERRVRERTAELEAANRELDAFSYSVSHDLRAPLRAMDGFSMALLEDCAGILDETVQDDLRRIRAASQRMADLIDDMQKLSRVTRTEMRREQVDLAAMAEEIGADLLLTHPGRQVGLVVASDLLVDGDAGMLRLALNNLLENAWKFTARCATARIEVGAREQDGERVLFVRDNGAGFDMAYVGKLFGAFQRLHSIQEFKGTGIGLAIVQRIVRRHGGRVWAEGAVGQGATIYFTLEKKGTDS
jgi:PAS domain S-box-containing protein